MVSTASRRVDMAKAWPDAARIEEYRGFKIAIVADSDGSNPRDDDGNAKLFTWDSGYRSPDEGHGWREAWQFREWMREERRNRHSTDPGVISLMLDRDGYTGELDIAGDWEDEENEYADGVIYATYAMIREWRGVARITRKIREETIAGLRDEVKIYNLWATGQVYGYVVGDAEDDHIDSCWGFISFDPDGDDYALEQGKEAVDALIADGREPVTVEQDDAEGIDEY